MILQWAIGVRKVFGKGDPPRVTSRLPGTRVKLVKNTRTR